MRNWDFEGILPSIRIGKRNLRRYQRKDILNLINKVQNIDIDSNEAKAVIVEAKTEVLASNAQFKASWDVAMDAMAISDKDGIVLSVNPAYLKLYGYSKDKIIGKHFSVIFHEASRKQAIKTYKETFKSQSEDHTPIITTIQRKDRSLRVVESRYAFIKDNPLSKTMLSVIRDITQITKLSSQISKQQNRLETLFNKVPAAVVIFRGPKQICIFSNPVFQSLLNNRECIGKPLLEVAPELKNSTI